MPPQVTKGGIALAAAVALAGATVPQAGPGAPLDEVERAAAMSQSDSVSATSRVTLQKAVSSGKPSSESEESNARAAADGAVQKIQDDGKAAGAAPDEKADKKADKKPEKLKKPVEDSRPTSSFGHRVSPITGVAGEFHTGQDFGGACGTPILSSAAGTVVEAGWHPHGGGNRVVVKHGSGLRTSYNHLASIAVAPGDTVDRGARVGAVGSTGASTGCHLHFEVVVDGEQVDPMKWM